MLGLKASEAGTENVIYCRVTNYHKLNSLKTAHVDDLTISVGQESALGSLMKLQARAFTGGSPGQGPASKLTYPVVGGTQLLLGHWTEGYVS